MMRTPDGEWTVEQVNRDGVEQFRVTYRGFDLVPYGSKRELRTVDDVRAVMARHIGGEKAFVNLQDLQGVKT